MQPPTLQRSVTKRRWHSSMTLEQSAPMAKGAATKAPLEPPRTIHLVSAPDAARCNAKPAPRWYIERFAQPAKHRETSSEVRCSGSGGANGSASSPCSSPCWTWSHRGAGSLCGARSFVARSLVRSLCKLAHENVSVEKKSHRLCCTASEAMVAISAIALFCTD